MLHLITGALIIAVILLNFTFIMKCRYHLSSYTWLWGVGQHHFCVSAENFVIKQSLGPFPKACKPSDFSEVSCWMITGERQSARIRSLYLKTILRQDIAFFDQEVSTGEVIGRMTDDTILIQDAIGEKVFLLGKILCK